MFNFRTLNTNKKNPHTLLKIFLKRRHLTENYIEQSIFTSVGTWERQFLGRIFVILKTKI